MATAKKSTAKVKKSSVNKSTAKKTAAKPTPPRSMPKEGRSPAGGLTAAGRAFFAQRDGSHLKPGVAGPADTPEKQKRKGSFLARTFTHPRGPMVDDQGRPTRLALSARAWGEAVPKTVPAAKKVAAKGKKLLEQAKTAKPAPAKKAARARS